MNTTLDLDADVLEAAKEISARTQRTTGQVISDLVRLALAITPSPAAQPVVLNGFEMIPPAGRTVTPEIVRQLVDDGE
ncbi:MAG: hypothetical protein R3E01_32215 [Pirellulaceae bacterium]|nr:hypothetical protein [Planctomycetales bacterium]